MCMVVRLCVKKVVRLCVESMVVRFYNVNGNIITKFNLRLKNGVDIGTTGNAAASNDNTNIDGEGDGDGNGKKQQQRWRQNTAVQRREW